MKKFLFTIAILLAFFTGVTSTSVAAAVSVYEGCVGIPSAPGGIVCKTFATNNECFAYLNKFPANPNPDALQAQGGCIDKSYVDPNAQINTRSTINGAGNQITTQNLTTGQTTTRQIVESGTTGILNIIVDMTIKTSVLVGLLFFALKTTKKLSGEIGASVTGALTKTMGMAGGVALGVTAMAGRATIGRRAQRDLDSGILQERMKKGGFGGFVARQQLAATKGIAGGSMDLRTTKLGSLAKDSGINFGEGQKGGFKAARDAQEAKELAYAKALEVSPTEKLMQEKNRVDADYAQLGGDKGHKAAAKELADAEATHKKAKEELAAAEEAQKTGTFSTPEARQKMIDRLDTAQKAVTEAGNKGADAQLARDTIKTAKETAEAAKAAIDSENAARRGAYAHVIEGRGSGASYALNVAFNPSHSGKTARDTANKIRTGAAPSYKSKGDSAKDNEQVIAALKNDREQVAKGNEQLLEAFKNLTDTLKGKGGATPSVTP